MLSGGVLFVGLVLWEMVINPLGLQLFLHPLLTQHCAEVGFWFVQKLHEMPGNQMPDKIQFDLPQPVCPLQAALPSGAQFRPPLTFQSGGFLVSSQPLVTLFYWVATWKRLSL